MKDGKNLLINKTGDMKGLYKCGCGNVLEIEVVGSKIHIRTIKDGRYVR